MNANAGREPSLRGGIVMGLGVLALSEEPSLTSAGGRVMNRASLSTMFRCTWMSKDRCDVDRHSRPHAPMGAHGVGEIGITGVGAAVANSIYNACGKRIRNLPITLDKLL